MHIEQVREGVFFFVEQVLVEFGARHDLTAMEREKCHEGELSSRQRDHCVCAEDASRGGVHRDIADLLTRVRVSVAPDLTASYPAKWPTRVAITTRSGRVCRGATEYPRGNGENPVSTADLERKCADLLDARCGAAVARQGMEALRRLETCRDIADLFRWCGDMTIASPLSVTTS